MKVYLRWAKSSRCAFPFVFDVSEQTTVSEICKLVMQQNNSNDNNPTFYNVKLRANDNTFINENLPQQVICDEELNKLIYKKIKYTKSDLLKIKNSICPITQVEFVEQQEIIELDCNHCFDAEAIIYWLTQEKAECPVCRLKYK